jgi:hypothetical protein
MKTPSIQIHDAKPSKKNPNAKYIVKSVSKNGEPLQQSEALNDVKAVKTHMAAMDKLWNTISYTASLRFFSLCYDHTKEQKFAKSGYANPTKQVLNIKMK